VVSDEEKAPERRQVGTRKASARESLLTCRNETTDGIETGAVGLSQDESGGCPLAGQMVPGMEATRAWSAAFTRNVGRPVPTLPSAV
jgi:hypothetical protein